MQFPPALRRQPDGDLLLSREAVQFLLAELQRLHHLLGGEHGHNIDEAGALETVQETANRQDFVNQLSAAAGVQAAAVRVAHLPATTRAVDHGDAMRRLTELHHWLSAAG